MQDPTSTSKASPPCYIEAVYLEDYDAPTLESLVRNLGEDKAAMLLEYTASDETTRKNVEKAHSIIKAKKEHLKVYKNIMILTYQASKLYKNDKGAARFTKETLKNVKRYEKTDTDAIQERTDSGYLMRIQIKNLVFTVCYLLGWIYQVPQRHQIVNKINTLLTKKGMKSFIASGPWADIPHAAEGLFGLNILLEVAISTPLKNSSLIRKQAGRSMIKVDSTSSIPTLIY